MPEDKILDNLKEIVQTIADEMKIILPIAGVTHQADSLSMKIANNAEDKNLILIIDSAHETDSVIFNKLQQIVLNPLVNSDKVFVVITGRGNLPYFDSHYLREAKQETLELSPDRENDADGNLKADDHIIDKTLEMFYPNIAIPNTDDVNEFFYGISRGFPLMMRIFLELYSQNEDNQPIGIILDAAIDTLLKTLTDKQVNTDDKYRTYLEKLSVLPNQYSFAEIQSFIDLGRKEERETRSFLADHDLIEWRSPKEEPMKQQGETKTKGNPGYQIKHCINNPIRYFLKHHKPDTWAKYKKAAKTAWESHIEELSGWDDRITEVYKSEINMIEKL